jgi:hypothetical protein
MYKGSTQGGGGSKFVDLTGLFPTKKGTGLVGFLRPQEFDALIAVINEAADQGVDLMFFVGKPREGAKESGRLSVSPSNRPSEERPRSASRGGDRSSPRRDRVEPGVGLAMSSRVAGRSPVRIPPRTRLIHSLKSSTTK